MPTAGTVPATFYKVPTNNRFHSGTFFLVVAHIHHVIPNATCDVAVAQPSKGEVNHAGDAARKIPSTRR